MLLSMELLLAGFVGTAISGDVSNNDSFECPSYLGGRSKEIVYILRRNGFNEAAELCNIKSEKFIVINCDEMLTSFYNSTFLEPAQLRSNVMNDLQKIGTEFCEEMSVSKVKCDALVKSIYEAQLPKIEQSIADYKKLNPASN